MNEVIERFLRYVKIDTQSSEQSSTQPSTQKQHNLAQLLYDELKEMGIKQVEYDEEKCYVYAHIPANDKSEKTLGFISHMDTSPEASGENVNPGIVKNYDGGNIELSKGIILSPETYPELLDYRGQDIIVTDGKTLLGADDKAGIAEIMTMVHTFTQSPYIKHGAISIAFTPDEEIGAGTDNFSLEKFGADYAYTVDGGGIGEVEYETFNAASAEIEIHGVNVHTGEAKNKMKNAARIAMEFDRIIPGWERPEHTQGKEGFFHLLNMEGTAEYAKLSYLIRDHDYNKFLYKKEVIRKCADMINFKYGANIVKIKIQDTYYNMKEKIYPKYMFLVDNVCSCMKELGITPKIQPIRGGTDGASLSFKGLPCPNICTGGHNFHGKYEYCPVQSMEKIVQLLIKLAQYN